MMKKKVVLVASKLFAILFMKAPKPSGVKTRTKIELRDFDYFAFKKHCAWLDAVPFFPILLLTLYNSKVLLR